MRSFLPFLFWSNGCPKWVNAQDAATKSEKSVLLTLGQLSLINLPGETITVKLLMTVIIKLYASKVNRTRCASWSRPLAEPLRNGKVMSAQVKRIIPAEAWIRHDTGLRSWAGLGGWRHHCHIFTTEIRLSIYSILSRTDYGLKLDLIV